MSGPSRAEIEELQIQYRGLLGKMYPSYAPAEVCVFYAALAQRMAGVKGAPDVKLRTYGRLLKHWIEKSRGQYLVPFHRHLLAAYHLLEQGHDLTTATKRARLVVTASETDPNHWLHSLLPRFKDGVLLVA